MLLKEKESVFQTFDSLYECVDYIEKTDRQGKWVEDNSSGKDKSKSFCPLSLEQAIDHAKNGWEQGRKKIASVQGLKHVQIFEPEIENNIQGFMPNVPSFLSGEPECMFKVCEQVQDMPIIDVYVDCSLSSNVSFKDAENYGIAIASLLEEIQKTHSVNMYVTSQAYKGIYAYHLTVKIKSSSQYIDKDVILFCIGNPAYERKICFRLIETHENLYNRFSSSYGTPINFSPDKIRGIKKDSFFLFGANETKNLRDKSVQGCLDFLLKKWQEYSNGNKNIANLKPCNYINAPYVGQDEQA